MKLQRQTPVFTWTEAVALPLALSLVEAQPFALGLAFLAVLFGGMPADAPLSMGALLLLLLGLLWWAMLLAHWQARGRLRSARLRALLRLCGLLLAWGALCVPFLSRLPDLASGPRAFLLGGEFLLAFWFWRRALGRARLGFSYEPLATSFKIGLSALLGLMLLILLTPQPSILLPVLENSLTIFFLSGLVTLSLARLGTLRQTRLANGRQADPTRSWLGALVMLCTCLIVLVFLLEAVFSYASFLWIVHAVQPVWDALGTVVGWLLYLLVVGVLAPLFNLVSWVLDRLKGGNSAQPAARPPSSPLARFANGQHLTQLPPTLLSIGRWVVLGAAALLLLLLVRASLRRWFLPYDAEQFEETRERLERVSASRPPRRARIKRRIARFAEPLDSVRAYYRLLLRTVAAAHPDLAHRLDETPLEYEQRLRPHLARLGTEQPQPVLSIQQDTATLRMLTQDYLAERYGQESPSPSRWSTLRQSMPGLLNTLGRQVKARGSDGKEPSAERERSRNWKEEDL